jgi:hypothetical protein
MAAVAMNEVDPQYLEFGTGDWVHCVYVAYPDDETYEWAPDLYNTQAMELGVQLGVLGDYRLARANFAPAPMLATAQTRRTIVWIAAGVLE